MPRPLAQTYACPALERLARQLLFAPPDRRVEQVRRAERLHDQIDPAIDYPYEFIAYRVTGYRSQEEPAEPLSGGIILPDLRLLIDTLTRSVAFPPDPGEPVETAPELAARLRVSVKTVTRWRQLGLRWRWESQSRLVFPRSGVERFLATNPARLDRAAQFTRMSADQRKQVLARAGRIAEAADVSLNQVATHLARRTGRAVETIRRLLEQHDRDHRESPIFADRTGPLTVKQRRVIARAYAWGISVGKMAKRFRRTRATIYRAINERRAAALRQVHIAYVLSPTFARPDADEVILRPEPAAPPSPLDEGRHMEHVPAPVAADLPESIRGLFDQPGIDADRQRSLLVRYNYLKYKADRLRAQLDRFEPRASQLDQIELWLAQAGALADRLIAANLGVVLSLARRQLIGQEDASAARLLELLEMSQDVVTQAIDTFDASRGQTFEAYLTWSLLRRFATHRMDKTKALRRPDAATALQRFRAAVSPPSRGKVHPPGRRMG